MRRDTGKTPKKRTATRGQTPRERFLEALASGLSVSRACQEARYPRPTAYRHREADPDFAKAWDDALEAGTDALEDEAVRRAKDGTLKPVFYQGEKCGDIREYSDTLLMFMLKARRPQKFRDAPPPGGGRPSQTPGGGIILPPEDEPPTPPASEPDE